MSYDNYKTARDVAWKILLECSIDSLPVRPSVICEHYSWVLADYHTGASSIALLGLGELTKQTDGFCAVTKNHTYIFFDSTLPAGRQRFTIAHEIGHLALGHVAPGSVTTVNREPEPGDSPLNVRRTSLRRGCWHRPASCTSWEPSRRRPSSRLVDSRAQAR